MVYHMGLLPHSPTRVPLDSYGYSYSNSFGYSLRIPMGGAPFSELVAIPVKRHGDPSELFVSFLRLQGLSFEASWRPPNEIVTLLLI